ncbi:putative NosD domain-containing protein [Gammaproteobacteria bacterium]
MVIGVTMAKNFWVLVVLGLMVVVSITACAPSNTGPEAISTPDSPFPHRVAVLPFTTTLADASAASTVRRVFYNFFSSLNYYDVELGNIDETLRKHDLYTAAAHPDAQQRKMICQYLGVDALISGEVTAFGKQYALIYTNTEASLKTALTRCDDGAVFWKMEHTVQERDGDVPLSLPGIAISLVGTFLSHIKASTIQVSARLASEMVATIPNPSYLAEAPPKITLMVHNGGGRLLRPGDALRIVVVGDPGAVGTWDISESLRGLALREEQRGLYVGEYTIRPKDREHSAYLTAHLASRSGKASSEWMDIVAPITVGTPTPLPSEINTNTVLTAAASPYAASGAVVIKSGATLRLEPGTSLWLSPLGLIVRGTLQAEGSSEHPIDFGGMGNTPWAGIFLDHSQGDNRLTHCVFRGARTAVNTRGARITINGSILMENEWGLVAAEDSNLTISNSVIRASDKAGLSVNRSVLALRDSVITGNSGGGVQLQQSKVTLTGNSFFGNAKWDFKNHDADPLLVSDNWWGTPDGAAAHTVGPVTIAPVLSIAPPMPGSDHPD